MEKHAAILEAARDLFTRQSFRGTSMDAVADAAGVSKLTVYGHFGDKANLFREVVREWMREHLPESNYRLDPALGIRENLLRVALIHARLDCSAEAAGTLRAVLGDCQEGTPRYGRMIWEESSNRTHRLVTSMLREAAAAGQLDIADADCAAAQLMALAKGSFLMRRLFGCTECETDYAKELEANATAGVDTFLRAYLPRD